MAIKARNLRQLMKEHGAGYKAKLREMLGVETKTTENGTFPAKYNASKAQIDPSEFSIRDLAEEFLGQEFVSGAGNPKLAESFAAELREASVPVGASTFTDINAFNATVGGLVEPRILQGFELPEYIGRKLVPVETTRTNGGKVIGIPNVVLPSNPVREGEEYPSVGLTERWVWAQKNKKWGQKLSLTREALVYDMTGELLATAESLGQSIGYMQEVLIAATVMGVDLPAGTPGFATGFTANTFLYRNTDQNGTPNATYQTSAGSGYYNYVNSQTQLLTTYAAFQATQKLLNLMREPETGYPILAKLKDVIVSPNNEYVAKNVINATQVLDTRGSSGLSTDGGVGTWAANPVPSVNLYSSPIWNKVLVDSGVSQTNADIRWYAGDVGKAFRLREVWAFNVQQANPLSPEMLNRDVVNQWLASWYGIPVVVSPWNMIENTN